VRLLANLLTFVEPGTLLAAIEGRAAWPHKVFEQYWPLSSSASFQPQGTAHAPNRSQALGTSDTSDRSDRSTVSAV